MENNQLDELAKETSKLLLAICRELHQGNEHILARGYLVDALKDFPSLEVDISNYEYGTVIVAGKARYTIQYE